MLSESDILAHFPSATKRSEGEYMALCPAHDDHGASLSISFKEGKVLFNCFSNCAYQDILAKAGLKVEDVTENKANSIVPGLTLDEYAHNKMLPIDFLRTLGIKEGNYGFGEKQIKAVYIPYYYNDGNYFRNRIRISLKEVENANGKSVFSRFVWDSEGKGKGSLLYGLWLVKPEERNIFIVEGESDTQTLLYNGYNVLGIPGASLFKEKRDVKYIQSYNNVYIFIEPDTGGTSVFFSFGKLSILGKLRFCRLQGYKDPSDAWKGCNANKEQFNALMRNAIMNAKTYGEFSAVYFNNAKDRKEFDEQQKKNAPASQETKPGKTAPKTVITEKREKPDFLGYAEYLYKKLCEEGNTPLMLKDTWHIYESGVYFRFSDQEFQKKILSYIQEETKGENKYNVVALNNAASETVANLAAFSLCFTDEAMKGEIIKSNSIKNRKIEFEKYKIVMNNGILDAKKAALIIGCDTDYTESVLYPHTPDYFSMVKLPYDFAPDADCPKFKKFLAEIQPDEETQKVIMRIFGYLLITETNLQKMFWFVGSGANGKGTLIKILIALIGRKNVSELKLQQLGERFTCHELTEKTLNINEETDQSQEIKSGEEYAATLKRLVDTDPFITCELKGKDTYTAICTARLVFATNQIPIFNDKSNGIRRRMVIIPFTRTIEEKEQNRNLDKEIIADELPGILNFALEGLKDILTAKDKSTLFECPVTKNALQEYMEKVNPDCEFWEMFTPANDTMIKESDLYAGYRAFFINDGKRSRSKETMRETIRANFKLKPRQPFKHDKFLQSNARYYVGIKCIDFSLCNQEINKTFNQTNENED